VEGNGVIPDVDQRLRDVFGAVFGCQPDQLRDQDSPQTVASWDSVNHMQLMLTIEDAFGVQFSPEEFASLTTFGAIKHRVAGGDGEARAG
jgi:acyl carrier protein